MTDLTALNIMGGIICGCLVAMGIAGWIWAWSQIGHLIHRWTEGYWTEEKVVGVLGPFFGVVWLIAEAMSRYNNYKRERKKRWDP